MYVAYDKTSELFHLVCGRRNTSGTYRATIVADKSKSINTYVLEYSIVSENDYFHPNCPGSTINHNYLTSNTTGENEAYKRSIPDIDLIPTPS